jgi:hypothetical protein
MWLVAQAWSALAGIAENARVTMAKRASLKDARIGIGSSHQ